MFSFSFYKWGVTSKSYQAADICDVRDEKLFSAMCNWSNHCLNHLLPSERDTGHDLRRIGHSYQLVCYNFSSTIGVALLFVCCMIHCKHLRLSDANKLSYLLTYLMCSQSWSWSWNLWCCPTFDLGDMVLIDISGCSYLDNYRFTCVFMTDVLSVNVCEVRREAGLVAPAH